MLEYLSGDHRAFEQLFKRLAPKVYGFFMRSFGDAAVAEELVQTTFFNIHRSRSTYRTGMPIRPWVFTIAGHVRRDELRRRSHRREDFDEAAQVEGERLQAVESAREEADGNSDRAVRVRQAIGRLPESQRVIVHLHRYEGLKLAEIAPIVGTTPLAVRARAFRAYERLRVELADLVGAGSGDDAA